jgi:hypothetical protein
MLALLVTACTRNTPTTNPYLHEPDFTDRGGQESPDASPRSTLAQQLQDAVQACREIQASRGIPIGCTVDAVEDVPAMVVSFASADDATKFQAVIAEHLAVPFCRATSAAEVSAAFVIAIPNQAASIIDCQSGRSKTIKLSASESPIERAMRTCDAMNQANLPVDCKMTKVEETPALLLAFGTVQLMNEYFAPAQELIVTPFCDATTAARDPGAVVVMVGRNAKTYHCDHKRWDPWRPVGNARREQAPPAGTGHRVAEASASEI